MITGDNLDTAKHIAIQAGIFTELNDTAITGAELQKLSDAELCEILPKLTVVARATPAEKLRLVALYQSLGAVVAMTGDGVNDAPALSKADIGIAMGKGGTDVAREAGDMILTDDQFATIVAGVEEARVVFDNLRKVTTFLFSTSFGEILVIVIALVLGYPVPLLPVQILWLNLVTDGFLTVPIATERREAGINKRHPSAYGGNILTRTILVRIVLVGIVMAVGTLWVYQRQLALYGLEVARTSALLILAMYQWFNAFNTRSEQQSIFKLGLFSNPAILAALAIEVILQIAATYLPFFQEFLRTVSLPPDFWLQAIIVTVPIILCDELRKLLSRRSI